MQNVLVRNIPAFTVSRIKEHAARNNRSVQSELLETITRVYDPKPKADFCDLFALFDGVEGPDIEAGRDFATRDFSFEE